MKYTFLENKIDNKYNKIKLFEYDQFDDNEEEDDDDIENIDQEKIERMRYPVNNIYELRKRLLDKKNTLYDIEKYIKHNQDILDLTILELLILELNQIIPEKKLCELFNLYFKHANNLFNEKEKIVCDCICLDLKELMEDILQDDDSNILNFYLYGRYRNANFQDTDKYQLFLKNLENYICEFILEHKKNIVDQDYRWLVQNCVKANNLAFLKRILKIIPKIDLKISIDDDGIFMKKDTYDGKTSIINNNNRTNKEMFKLLFEFQGIPTSELDNYLDNKNKEGVLIPLAIILDKLYDVLDDEDFYDDVVNDIKDKEYGLLDNQYAQDEYFNSIYEDLDESDDDFESEEAREEYCNTMVAEAVEEEKGIFEARCEYISKNREQLQDILSKNIDIEYSTDIFNLTRSEYDLEAIYNFLNEKFHDINKAQETLNNLIDLFHINNKKEINRWDIKDNIENWVSELYWENVDPYLPKIMQKIIVILK